MAVEIDTGAAAGNSLAPRQGPRDWKHAIHFSLQWLMLRPALVMVLLFISCMAGNAMLTLRTGIPLPHEHDEFSYLLAADTFAHGRLTNPTHPLCKHFETYHVLQIPSYMSKYHPAQGMFLAVGQVITGYPIVGVWISAGLMCAAIYWMLLAWLRPSWALLGGILVLMCFGFLGYWSRSYWGGAVAAIGGALVYGALRRIIKKPLTADALLFGLGLAILAFSRPFEGAVSSVPACVVLAVWLFKSILGKSTRKTALLRIGLPLMLVVLATLAFMGYYNYRITGKPLLMPYMAYTKQYKYTPLFLGGVKGAIPASLPEHMKPIEDEEYYTNYGGNDRSYSRLLALDWGKICTLMWFYVGDFDNVPLLVAIFLPWVLFRNRWMLLAACALGALLLANMSSTVYLYHYTAPGFCLFVLLFLACLDRLYSTAFGKLNFGRWAACILVGILLLVSTAQVTRPLISGVLLGRLHLPNSDDQQLPATLDSRPAVIAKIQKLHHGPALVIVRYSGKYDIHEEWVYNAADIDGSQVVWAQDLGAAQNAELLAYYPKRSAWLLEIREPDQPLRLLPFDTATAGTIPLMNSLPTP